MDLERSRYVGLFSQFSTVPPRRNMSQNHFTPPNRCTTNRSNNRGNMPHSRAHYGVSYSRNNKSMNNSNPNNHKERREYIYNRQPRGNLQNQRGRSANQTSSNSSLASSLVESTEIINYLCPGCKMPYDYSKTASKSLTGRIPRILKCEHTMCEECIQKSKRTTNQISCAICSRSSHDTNEFDFNHYVLGHITSSKMMQKPLIDFPTVTLVAVENSSDLTLNQDNSCGFRGCGNMIDIICLDCCEQYCHKCDKYHHESNVDVESNTHRRNDINKISLELNKCPDHLMLEELYCNNCKEKCCCYCMLEKHEGHTRRYLARLTEVEKKELNDAFTMAQERKKKLQDLQRQIPMSGPPKISTVEYNIAQHFSNIHAKLYLIEKKLIDEAKKYNESQFHGSIMRRLITSHLDNLNYLLRCFETQEEIKLNLQGLLEKFREINNLNDLTTGKNNDTLSMDLVVDDEIQDLQKFFHLETHIAQNSVENESYEMKGEDDAKISEEIDTSHLKLSSDFNSKLTEISPKEEKILNSSRGVFSELEKTNFLKEPVCITQIQSLNKFFVQLLKDEKKFLRMEKDIENHVKTMKVGVEEVNIHELYLAHSLIDEKKWCRVRVIKKLSEEDDSKYSVYFVDFGNNSNFHKKELMYISAKIAKKKPFALQCKLYNCSDVEWPNDSHYKLAKLLEDHSEVLMINKGYSSDVFTVDLHITYSSGQLHSVTDLLIYGTSALNTKKDANSVVVGSCELFGNSDSFVKGVSYDITLTYVQDPDNVYFQKASYKDAFKSLVDSMNAHYKSSKCDIHIPVENSYVIVNYPSEFGNWHRALILQVFTVSKSVKIFLVDLGNKITVPWRVLRRLIEAFKMSECLAVCGKMSDIESKNRKGWIFDEEAKLYFDQYISEHVVLKILVSSEEPLEIVLFEKFSTYDENINAILVERDLAISVGKLSKTSMWLHKNEDKLDEGEFLPIYKDFSDDEDSEENVEGIKICLQIVRFDNPHSIYGFLKSKKDEAERLHEELQLHYRVVMELQESWKINDRIVVFNTKDRYYYRGKIIEISLHKYAVYLLDTGKTIEASEQDLRKMSPYFSNTFPNFVLKCYLAEIKPAGDSNKWSQMSLEWFQKLFKEHEEVYIKKVSDDVTKTSMPVTMWYTKITQGAALEPCQCKYISISKKAVNAGIAFWVKPVNNITATILKDDTPQIECVRSEPSTSNAFISESSMNGDGKPSPPNIQITVKNERRSVTEVPMERETIIAKVNEWLPPDPLKEKHFEAYITCAENEGYLFVQDLKRHEAYKILEANMKDFFDSLPKSKKPFEAKEQQMVTIWSNGYWYRGEILSVIDEDTVKAIMIDFGSDHITKMAHIYNKIMYADIPTLVTKIKLFDVHAKSGKWSEDDVNLLLDVISEKSYVKIRSNLDAKIPLADVYDNDGCCLNDKLTELSPNLYRRKATKKLKSIADPNELLDEKMNFKSKWSSIIEDDDDMDDYPHAKLNLNEKIEVDFISVYDYKTVSIFLVKDDARKETFEELHDKIQVEAPNLEMQQDLRQNLPCLSIFSEDNTWYRAKILEINNDDVTVFYVDYGNFETVKASTIKSIKPELMNFPARFLVAEIPIETTNSDQESTVIMNYMEKLIGTFKIVEVIDEEPLKIHIYDDDICSKLYYKDLLENGSLRIL